VILSGSILSDNTASNSGGGIYSVHTIASSGTVKVLSCILSGNSAGWGGGIYNFPGGTVILSGSTLSGNSASHDGGGIDNEGGTVILYGSTLSGNSAFLFGGGIDNEGVLTVINSTVSTNNAGLGGDLYEHQSAGATLTVTNSTITDIYYA
jgi:predicted outer membrane repeat protein